MIYLEYSIEFPSGATEEQKDIAVAELGDLGFDSFSEEDGTVKAYIPKTEHPGNEKAITAYLKEAGLRYVVSEIKDDINWNSAWESGFSPTLIGTECYVRAPFHEARPEVKYEIVIMPKMSFGTGHHATTYLMLDSILKSDVEGKTGLDMGSGTGVLAILAVMRGAKEVDAIDVDSWAYENCRENIKENSAEDKINVILGDASLLTVKDKYDFILANINRNILLADMDKYAVSLKEGGFILMSGFLNIDVDILTKKAASCGLATEYTGSKDGWHIIKCIKTDSK